jgi:hypothetical protein
LRARGKSILATTLAISSLSKSARFVQSLQTGSLLPIF